jgi:hypothetical protein
MTGDDFTTEVQALDAERARQEAADEADEERRLRASVRAQALAFGDVETVARLDAVEDEQGGNT